MDLAKSLGLSAKKPWLGILIDKSLSEAEEIKLRYVLEGTASLDLEVAILTDEKGMDLAFENVRPLHYDRLNREKLLAAADFTLSFEFNDVEEMMMHGAVPISGERSEMIDYNPNRETGNGFIFKKNDVWGIFAALVRAVETFKFPYDWKHIMRAGMRLGKKV